MIMGGETMENNRRLSIDYNRLISIEISQLGVCVNKRNFQRALGDHLAPLSLSQMLVATKSRLGGYGYSIS